jgi:hypothetical protein
MQFSSELRFFDGQGPGKFARGNACDSPTQNFSDHNGGVSRAIDTKIGELIGGEALGVERPKAGFIAEQRATRHRHATGKKNFDGGVQPDDGDAGIAKKFGGAGLRVGTSAESKDGRFLELDSAAERGTQLIGFQLTKSEFAVAFEEFGDGDARGLLDAFVEIDKVPTELPGESSAHGAFARAHETG